MPAETKPNFTIQQEIDINKSTSFDGNNSLFLGQTLTPDRLLEALQKLEEEDLSRTYISANTTLM